MKTKNYSLKFLVMACTLITSSFFSSCGGSEQATTEETAPAAPTQIIPAGETGNRYFVDENNKTLFGGAKFYNTYEFRNGYCVVSKMVGDKELRGVIDSTGKEVIPCTQDAILHDVEDQMVQFSTGGQYGYLDLTGKVVIPCAYSDSKGFSNGLVKLQKDYKKWGILDRTGKEVVPFEYDEIGVWGDDLAPVKKSGKWGFINKAGALQFPAEYDEVSGFEQGVCLAAKGNKYALINTKNEELTDYVFDDYKVIVDVSENEFSSTGYSKSYHGLVMEEGLMIVSKDGLWGLMDLKGEAVLPYEYTTVDLPQSPGKVEITQDDKRGRFDLATKKVTWY